MPRTSRPARRNSRAAWTAAADEDLVGGYLAAKYGITTGYTANPGMVPAATLTNAPATLAASDQKVTVLEGKRATVTVKAGGAQKLYWMVKKGTTETMSAVDCFSYTVGGRVTGDESLTLKLKTPATASKITYLKELNWNQNDLIFGKTGIAALTFCNVPILPDIPRSK